MFKRKKLLCRTVILLTAFIIAAGAAIIAARPDWRFLISYNIAADREKDDRLLVKTDKDSLTLVKVKTSDIQDEAESSVSLMLVNKEHELPKNFAPDIVEYKTSGVMMNACITQAYSELSDAVRENCDQPLYVTSSYRTAQEQEEILKEEGGSLAMTPGSSEHQTGLALDLSTDGFAGRAFLKSKAGQFVYEHCCEYGFIIRYPAFTEKITGIEFEPWHIRYVGLPHSEIITRMNVTFEEYVSGLEYGSFYRYGDYIISRQQGAALSFPEGEAVISSDNCGGYIITVKTNGGAE